MARTMPLGPGKNEVRIQRVFGRKIKKAGTCAIILSNLDDFVSGI
jgi:hypothetical protein